MLHAYCVRRAGDPPPDSALVGLDGATVSLVERAGVGVWLSRVEQTEATVPTPERLREHDHVVRAALRTATPLPIRFGARLRDEEAVAGMLEARHEELLAGLARVSGRVEVGVTVGWSLDSERERILESHPQLRHAIDAPTSGRQYLERRRGERLLEDLLQESAQALLSRVGAALGAEELRACVTLLPRPEVAGMLAHLVPREEVAAYRRRFERAREALPEVTLSLSGPWAPYSFIGDV